MALPSNIRTVYISGPKGDRGERGDQGPEGPGGPNSQLSSVNITLNSSNITLQDAGLSLASLVNLSTAAIRNVIGVEAVTSLGGMFPTKQINNTSAFNISFLHQNGSAVAKDRIITPDGSTFLLLPGKVLTLSYDYVASRWRCIPGNTDLAISAPPSIAVTNLAGSSFRAAKEDHSHKLVVDNIFTTNLSSRLGERDGEIIVTSGYATSADGGNVPWKFALGVSAGSDGYTKINCANGQWQIVRDSGYINARWLGAGLGLGSESARLIAAMSSISVTGGKCYWPRGTYTWDANVVFSIPNNVHICGDGEATKYRRTTDYGGIDASAKTGVTVSDLVIEMDHFQNFMRLIDFTSGASNCAVRNVRAYLTPAAAASIIPGSHTLHFVLADGATGYTVENCHYTNLQVKMGTFGSVARISIRDNIAVNPIDYAISVVSTGITTNELEDIEIRGNKVYYPEASGGIYIGHDAESGRIGTLKRVAVDDNFVIQDRELGGVLIVIHLGNVSEDISICRNILRNEHASYDGSSLIRVRSTLTGKPIDGLRVCENILYGCDHGGIYLDVHGRNIQVQNNNVRNTRGIYVHAVNGNIENLKISGNIVDDSVHHGFWIYALSGNINGLTMANNDAVDAFGAPEGENAGYWFDAAVTYTIRGTIYNCRAANRTTLFMDYAFYHRGAGASHLKYIDCDGIEVTDGFLRLDNGSAGGHNNQGFGIVPNTEEITVKLSDVSAASSATVVCPCAGTVIKVISRLGGPITIANASVVTAIDNGGGFVNITGGGFTVAFSGSAAGDIDEATPSAANVVEQGDILRVTSDGASSTTAAIFVTFVISKG